MSRLILIFNKEVIKEFPFGKDSISIGRQEDNTIMIDNLAVSGHHAKVDKAGSDFILTDLQSTNGTFVNDKKIVSHKLTHGDKIHIGKHFIVFAATDKGEVEPAEKPKKIDLDKTMMLDTATQRELLSKQKAGSPAPVKKAAVKVGVINFIDNSGLGEIELSKKLTKIGKADTSEVKLSGMLLGATVATISRRPTGYTITFTGGMTKVKVNNEVLRESAVLKEFDTVEIGSYKFQYYQKDA